MIRPRRPLLSSLAALVLVTGCSGDDDAAPSRISDATSDTTAPVTAAPRPFEMAVPLCADLPDPSDSLDWSGIQWAAAPDPLRARDALIASLNFPYVVEYWGATGVHEGWLVIGVSGGALELQELLDAKYPGARVLAMPLDWTFAELTDLANRVTDATIELALTKPVRVSMSIGQVRVDLDRITEERVRALDQFAGQRVCVDGTFA